MGSVFTAQTQLYNARDNEMLLAMPIPSAAILGSRMIMLLLLNYFYEAIVAIPAIAVWIAAGLYARRWASSFCRCCRLRSAACLAA